MRRCRDFKNHRRDLQRSINVLGGEMYFKLLLRESEGTIYLR